MRINIFRKIIVALVIILPVFSFADCKKQVKCGCGNDVIRTLANVSATVFWTDGQSIQFTLPGEPYSTFWFCNPSEMLPNLKDAKYGDILQLSGAVYWDCSFVYQQSNSSYQSYYGAGVYQVQVTDLFIDLYGKNKPATVKPLDSTMPSL